MGIFDKSKKAKRPLTAAAGGLIEGGNPARPEAIIRRSEDWQRRVMSYKDVIPEALHAGTFVENVINKVSLVADSNNPIDKTVTNLLKSVPLGRMAQNIFYVGEVLVSYTISRETGDVTWESYGIEDYTIDGKIVKVRQSDGKFYPLDNSTKAFRVYRQDPSNRFKSISSHKALADTMEGMYVYQLADTAISSSRLAGAGILYIPNDEFVDIPDLDGGEPEPGTQSHFEMRLRQAMTESLSNRNAEDAKVPLVMFGSAEYSDSIRHVLMERVDDAEAFANRMSAYARRYGRGIDLPEEVVMGMGDSNHWGAWKVDQNTWQYYLEPMCDLIKDAIHKNFVKPFLKNLNVETCVEIVCDASKAISKPDKTDAAIRAHASNALSAEGVLHYAGMDEKYIHPLANGKEPSLGKQPDGNIRMPSANFRGSEGQPVSDRNFER